jgi:hypothetical protein
MKIQDIKTRFTKGSRSEMGELLSFHHEEGGIVSIRSKIAPAGTGKGKLELFRGKTSDGADEEVLLLQQEEAMSSHEICQYMIPYTDEVKEVCLSIENDKIMEREIVDDSALLSKPKLIKEKPLDFAKMDYNTVHREIMDIKSCRTHIFVGTLGVIGALGVAVLGILGRTSRSGWELWLPFAAAIPTLLLTCAILSSIHKARALNERIGYLEILGEYLTGLTNIAPKLCNWLKAQRTGRRCEIYNNIKREIEEELRAEQKKQKNLNEEKNRWRNQSQNLKKKETELTKSKEKQKMLEVELKEYTTCGSDTRCTIVARNLSRRVVKKIKLKPYFLEGFTSLSTHIYSGAYLISVVALLFATINTLSILYPTLSNNLYWVLVLAGFIITTLLIILCFYTRKKADIANETKVESETAPRETRTEKIFKVYKFVAGMILPASLIALLLASRSKNLDWLRNISAYGLGAVIAAIATSLAYSFLRKVEDLRRGRYSLERWRHIWKIRFQRCPLMERITRFEFKSIL